MSRLASLSALLDELSPDVPASGPGWEDVLTRADVLAAAPTNGSPPAPTRLGSLDRRPWTGTKRLLVAAAVLAAILIPLGALATVNGWWSGTPRPLNKPVVVTRGSWDGHPWNLVAYVSAAGVCWSITFEDSPRGGTALGGGCGSIVGIRPPRAGLEIPTVDWRAGASSDRSYPKWIAGPIVETARLVVIHFRNGTELRVPASDAAMWKKVGWYRPVRFFAAQLPAGINFIDVFLSVDSIAGLDAHGNVVACYASAYPVAPSGGGPPLTACTR